MSSKVIAGLIDMFNETPPLWVFVLISPMFAVFSLLLIKERPSNAAFVGGIVAIFVCLPLTFPIASAFFVLRLIGMGLFWLLAQIGERIS